MNCKNKTDLVAGCRAPEDEQKEHKRCLPHGCDLKIPRPRCYCATASCLATWPLTHKESWALVWMCISSFARLRYQPCFLPLFVEVSTLQLRAQGKGSAAGQGRIGSSPGAGRKAALPDDPTASCHSSSALENQCMDPANSGLGMGFNV